MGSKIGIRVTSNRKKLLRMVKFLIQFFLSFTIFTFFSSLLSVFNAPVRIAVLLISQIFAIESI